MSIDYKLRVLEQKLEELHEKLDILINMVEAKTLADVMGDFKPITYSWSSKTNDTLEVSTSVCELDEDVHRTTDLLNTSETDEEVLID